MSSVSDSPRGVGGITVSTGCTVGRGVPSCSSVGVRTYWPQARSRCPSGMAALRIVMVGLAVATLGLGAHGTSALRQLDRRPVERGRMVLVYRSHAYLVGSHAVSAHNNSFEAGLSGLSHEDFLRGLDEVYPNRWPHSAPASERNRYFVELVDRVSALPDESLVELERLVGEMPLNASTRQEVLAHIRAEKEGRQWYENEVGGDRQTVALPPKKAEDLTADELLPLIDYQPRNPELMKLALQKEPSGDVLERLLTRLRAHATEDELWALRAHAPESIRPRVEEILGARLRGEP